MLLKWTTDGTLNRASALLAFHDTFSIRGDPEMQRQPQSGERRFLGLQAMSRRFIREVKGKGSLSIRDVSYDWKSYLCSSVSCSTSPIF